MNVKKYFKPANVRYSEFIQSLQVQSFSYTSLASLQTVTFQNKLVSLGLYRGVYDDYLKYVENHRIYSNIYL